MLKNLYSTNKAVLEGFKPRENKILDYSSSITFTNTLEQVEQLKANAKFNQITDNNNLDLYRKWISKTVEAAKYFNYYNPQVAEPRKAELLNYNLTTVEALEKKYDLEDGEIFEAFYNEEK